ncbi:Arc family DNA-binding protein [Pseudomonas aeruginosa]|uniref:Arc family DNA-binding protein n=1 Tax=Pseudomonas aeruginosa TaxID=287 RepID=UPI00104A29BF|nr:Arc family DNA-binding protein [Pseudomonas aeruginosa]
MKTRDINPFGLRMPQDIREYVAKRAESEECSLNWLICKILKEEMDRDRSKTQAAA